jgi:hypothetical protein
MESCNKDKADLTPADKASDLQNLSAIGAWCTPEFVMRSARASQSSCRANQSSSPTPLAVAGRYAVSRTVLATAATIESAIRELRHQLESSKEDTEERRQSLLQNWIAIEPCLLEDEQNELRDAVLRRLFPQSKAPSLCRSKNASGGGHP